MHLTLLNAVGIFAPLILMATLYSVWREGRSRKLMLRMLPPELRPVIRDQKPFLFARVRATLADRKQHGHPLWTLRDCRMELLTESTMHAFEANAKAYSPDCVASNYPPGRLSARIASYNAHQSSILLRTLERSTDMITAGAAAMYSFKPEIDDNSGDILFYTHPAPSAQIRGVA
jgi:hypothetical protein